MVEPQETFRSLRDAVSVRQVFGEPVERDGVTVIPAATVIGGGGGGGGNKKSGGETSGEGDGDGGEPTTGTGMGFAMVGWASGAFEVREGRVDWRPTLDVTRIVLAAEGVALVLGLATLTVLSRQSGRLLARSRKR
jgi:hypothetical protein